MITYIDTSTLLELIIEENGSERAMTIWSSADAVASVNLIVVEARMATVLTDLGGLASNLDDIFEPAAEALELAGGAAS